MADRANAGDWAVFDLEPGSSQDDLQRAYRRRRALYDAASLATYSLFAEEERQLLLDALEQAYRRLLRTFQAVPQRAAEPSADPASSATEITATPAAYLKRLRELRGLSLADIAQRTKIRPAVLEALEAEAIEVLPAPVYVRGFVIQIARLLGAPEPEALAQRYLSRLASLREGALR